MFDGTLIPLLPPSLAGSITVTVWIGVMVVATSNLRLGWVLSGLVVPGYMVPLIIANPLSAGVVFAEGLATYFVVWFYSELLAPRLRWSTFFGRDRFFALVVVSVGVRLAGDGWLLPALGSWLEQRYAFAFDYRNDLHSFGLIVVSLIANNFWKTGLLRGAGPMAVQVGLTWLLVSFLLVPLTNFNAESTAILYEDIAAAMLASPKAYIILIVTAFVASRLNLFYGWDFSGILIPSLLALQWYQPFKLVGTFAEAVAILVLSSLVLRLPYFRSMTVEGGRKIMVFFSMSLAYKFVMGWAFAWWLPQLQTTDYYGFGYLLATLIALKAHDKNIFGRLSQAVLQTSLAGVAAATVIGFVLLLVPDPRPPSLAVPQVPEGPQRLEAPVQEALLQSKTSFFMTRVGEAVTAALPEELAAFSDGIRLLLAYRANLDPTVLRQAQLALDTARYRVSMAGGLNGADYLFLEEQSPQRHWGTYAIALKPRSRLLIEVPFPVDETLTFEAGAWMLSSLGANGFSAAPGDVPDERKRRADILSSPQTIFHAFHREMASDQVLQVRSREADTSALVVSGGLPTAINLLELRDWVGPLRVDFGAGQDRNLQRETTRGSFSELWLTRSPTQSARLFARAAPAAARLAVRGPVASSVLEKMTEARLPAPGSEAYRRRGLDQLLRLDREVLSPMLHIALDAVAAGPDMQAARLAGAVASARSMGIDLAWVAASDGDFLILHDTEQHGGLTALRIGIADPYVFEVPRPLRERSTVETAVRLWSDLEGRALVLAGAAADANRDGSADVLNSANVQTLFQLAHQVLLRDMGTGPAVALQVRAMGLRLDQAPPAEAVLAFDRMPVDPAQINGIAVDLTRDLVQHGLSPMLNTGGPEMAGYNATTGPQASYMEQTKDKVFAVLWVSRTARAGLQQETLESQRRAFQGLGIPVRQSDIGPLLARSQMAGSPLPQAAIALAMRYVVSADIVALAALQATVPGLRLERIEDAGGRGAFLLMSGADGGLRAVLSLVESLPGSASRKVPAGVIGQATAQAYLAGRERWMEVAP